jgi:16S rRNA (uracil1498-N3)-methyltransferase
VALHFLSPDAATTQVGETIVLDGAEAKHAHVRRLRVGEPVTVGDGAGVWLSGEVVDVTPEVVIRVTGRMEHPAPKQRITLVQALAKADRDELAVQAACELGVDEVVPWHASRSISRWEGAKEHKGRQRWASIVREAAKQAHRAWLPEVSQVVSTAQLIARSKGERMLVLEPTAQVALSELVTDERDIVLVVGPEGGFTAQELQAFEDAGAELVRLGDSILRTSTAGPVAIAVLSVALGRW